MDFLFIIEPICVAIIFEVPQEIIELSTDPLYHISFLQPEIERALNIIKIKNVSHVGPVAFANLSTIEATFSHHSHSFLPHLVVDDFIVIVFELIIHESSSPPALHVGPHSFLLVESAIDLHPLVHR